MKFYSKYNVYSLEKKKDLILIIVKLVFNLDYLYKINYSYMILLKIQFICIKRNRLLGINCYNYPNINKSFFEKKKLTCFSCRQYTFVRLPSRSCKSLCDIGSGENNI